ncbi:myo-inositol-1(or 4)-monophosphatase [Amycolatopsis marina]|uniref:Histidinol-phosphatase n=1 Tax=Amycolatopsis marina TaxID=490629 RepID=A0A1I0WVK5_9PSEU|nr:inositol monophosphatase [Amycolatopsis marina]SFA92188.1 myo-inositol-1(or 4)-monophosphatase [Amycolatopsis marina]
MRSYLDTAIAAASAAGTVLAARFTEGTTSAPKGDKDVVTPMDHAAEQVCLSRLRQDFPDFSHEAEESGRRSTGSSFTWYVDPLDGTANYLTGNPYFSVSIALVQAGEVITAVVHNPVTGDFFTAERGSGARLNGSPIHAGSAAAAAEAMAATAYSFEPALERESLRALRILGSRFRRVVVNFAPALDLCNIARGRLSCLVDCGSTPVDHAAGSLVLTEAGGVLRNYGGGGWTIRDTGVVASTPSLAAELDRMLLPDATAVQQ